MANIPSDIRGLKEDVDDLHTYVYILSGVFGGVCFFLLVAVITLNIAVLRLYKKVHEEISRRRVEDEASARRFSGYTGEEIHRRLKDAQTTVPAMPTNRAPPANPRTTSREQAFVNPNLSDAPGRRN